MYSSKLVCKSSDAAVDVGTIVQNRKLERIWEKNF